MPNHVYYHFIPAELTAEQTEKLHTIAETLNGFCGHYRPMPDDMRDTTSPCRVVTQKEYDKQMKENEKIDRTQPWYHEPKPITKKMQKALIEKYGTDNWYDWAYNNWGTKWGCYDHDIDGGNLRFSTAWSLFDTSLLTEIAVDFPTFVLAYEEEQGWGGEFVFEDGECIERTEYDAPTWHSTDIETEDGTITQLLFPISESHFNEGADEGYYYDYDTNCPVLEDILTQYNLNDESISN
jgi:hypothetical protein